ncbi:MAG: F0F1 ATP synthase subunit delta [Spirochaetaceae bacterium]|nr:F0F1 ATP synthase subunit delta [Spirochaetaceae bacterium]
MKFTANRWAEAFVEVCDPSAGPASAFDQSERGLAVIKAVLPSLSRFSGMVSGSAAAARFDGFLNAALQKCGYSEKENGVEAARALIFLLIKRADLPYGSILIEEIENLLLKKRGVLSILLDCAEKPDGDFLEKLKGIIIKRERAREARVKVGLMPEILGGYRITIDDTREDFSVLGQMKQLERALSAI